MEFSSSIIGLLGEHIENSLSPLIHQHFIHHYSLNYYYFPFQITSENLKSAIMGVRALGIQGLNITISFKERSMEFMDYIDSSARKIGAINTVVQRGKRLYGYNTDWIGFKIPLLKNCGFDLINKKAVVLGAGGAARAVVFTLGEEGCSRISIFNRTLQHALEVKNNFNVFFPFCTIGAFSYQNKNMQKEIDDADIIINATPLGSWYYPDRNPLPDDIKLPSRPIVYDLIYDPDRTPLLKTAEMSGNMVINGKAMLVYQAAESFYLWTDIHPEQEIITQILEVMDKKVYSSFF